MTKFDNFTNAFAIGGFSTHENCQCGVVYFHPSISDENFDSLNGTSIIAVADEIQSISFQG